MNSTAVNGTLSSCRGRTKACRTPQILLVQRWGQVYGSQLVKRRVRVAAASQLQVSQPLDSLKYSSLHVVL
jgi:hypothetical protein